MTVVAFPSPQAVVSVQILSPSVRKERRSLYTGIPRSSAALCTSAVSPACGKMVVL